MKGIKNWIFLSLVLVLVISGCSKESSPDNSTGGASSSPPASSSPGSEEVVATNSNPMSDYRVRQAIDYAIDMKSIVDQLMGGKALLANSLTPNGDWKVDGLEDYEYNPDKARQLLKEAKWDPNYVLDIVFYYGDQQTVDMMTAVQAYLADVGVKSEIRKLEGDLASQLWVAPSDPVNGPSVVKWDLAYAAIGALSMHEYYDRFMTGNASNSHTPGDPELDALIQATSLSADPTEQKAAFNELQKYENKYLPSIPLYYQQVFVVQSNQLDRKDAPYGNEQFSYDWDIITWDIPANNEGKKVLRTNGGPVEFFETPFLNPGHVMSAKVLYDRLLVADENLTPKEGQLASSFDISEDGRTVQITLKDGIKWHDGADITASDVKWTFETATKVPTLNAVFASTLKELKGYQAYVEGTANEISGITIADKTITFEFDKLAPNALLMFTQLPPLPQKHFEGVDPLQIQQAKFWQSPIGSGPFKIKEVSMNNYTVLDRFEDYHEGKAIIEEIMMYPSGESDTNMVKNAAAKQLDYAYTKSVEDVTAIMGMDHMKVTEVDIRYTRLFFVNKFPKQ